jgi:hypothetical protein
MKNIANIKIQPPLRSHYFFFFLWEELVKESIQPNSLSC